MGNRVAKIADSVNGTISYGYDGLDHVTSVTTPNGSVTYSYYANGLRQTMTVSGQPTVSYAYDAGNRLTQITQAAGAVNNNSAQTVGFAYDADNRLIQKTLTNGIAMHYSYDNANRLTGISYAQGQNTIGNLTYGYDAAGHRVATGGTFARRAPTPASTSAVDAANRLSTFNGVTMQYDANGNLLNDGTNTYNWNARNQLVQITGGTTSTFAYDALGRRQSVTVNGVASNYVYDGLNIVGELNTGTTYLTGLGVDQMLAMESSNGAQIASYLTDALGSTIRLTDQNGSKLVDYTYSLYGATNADASIVNPFQYAGRENDGTGLYYNRARYYSPTLQRFISQDPSGLSAGVNMYAYVDGNPVSFIDPLGLNPFQPSTVTALEEAVLEGNVDAIQTLADAAGVNADAPLAEATANANKINHIFNNAAHNLDPAVKACGSPGRALKIFQELGQQNFPRFSSGLQKFVVNANGVNVTVTGVMVNGVFKLGTAYR